MLCQKVLPVQLAMDIMELADYTPKRVLRFYTTPFHGEDRDELAIYLEYY
jgi:hypothetical protein